MKSVVLCLCFAGLLIGQGAAPLEFDVASVKVNQTGSGHTSVHHEGGTLNMNNITLKACISVAYGVADSQISGPGWLETERYDILAKAAADARQDQYALRLRPLLAERFKLAAHREMKETTVYALAVAKNGLKIKKDDSGQPAADGLSSGPGRLEAKGVSMARLTEFLGRPRAALDRPIVNATGLDGVYTFSLQWAPDDIASALQEQLGLKLEARKAPVEMLIIDHVEKVPTEN